MAECDFCEEEVSMPYTCGYCGGSFCPEHRLPENHDCDGLDELDEKSREEGRIYRGVSDDLEPEELERESSNRFTTMPFDLDEGSEERGYPYSRKSPEKPSGLDFLKNFFLSDMTSKLLLIIVIVYFGQMVAQFWLGNGYGEFMKLLAPTPNTYLSRPWTLLTSIFVHGSLLHMVVNGVVLFFIGSALERRIGGNKFIYLFLGSGVIASLAQILVTSSEPPVPIVLGASGAILGILGALTVLSPRMPVLLFFFLPMQLWMVTLGYGLIEVTLAFLQTSDPIGHVAHFSGLAIGLLYGLKLRRDSKQRYKNLFESLMDKYDH